MESPACSAHAVFGRDLGLCNTAGQLPWQGVACLSCICGMLFVVYKWVCKVCTACQLLHMCAVAALPSLKTKREQAACKCLLSYCLLIWAVGHYSHGWNTSRTSRTLKAWTRCVCLCTGSNTSLFLLEDEDDGDSDDAGAMGTPLIDTEAIAGANSTAAGSSGGGSAAAAPGQVSASRDTAAGGAAIDDYAPISYNYSFFHLIFALASMYIAMLMTGWGAVEQEKDRLDVGWTSVWVKTAAEWVTAVLYSWTLIAPAMFPDRDFGF